MNSNMVYEVVKWRRELQAGIDELPETTTRQHVVSGYCDLDEEEIQIDIPPPRVCQIRSVRHESYLQPPDNDMSDRRSGLNVPPQPQHQAEGRMPDLQDDKLQGAAAADIVQLSESQVDGSVQAIDDLPRTEERRGKTDSYVLPSYCELNDAEIITVHQQADRSSTETTEQSPPGQIQTAGSDRLSLSSDDESQSGNDLGETVAEGIQPLQDMKDVISVPLIAECSWNTENSVSAPDQDSPPENYNHPFEDDYVGSKKDDHSDD